MNQATAQVTASAIASATIIRPVALTKTADLNFGNMTAATNAAGAVILSPSGERTSSGGVLLPSTPGAVSAASFEVAGEGNYTYSITLPTGGHIITRRSGTETMTVGNFTSEPAGTGRLVSGRQLLRIGATLNVAPSQSVGSYTSSAGFAVTVNYN